MISESAIVQQLRDLLSSEVDACCEDGRLRVLTPFEYPDGDGVVVVVEEMPDGQFVISDGGSADATLIGRISTRAIGSHAAEIARRFDAVFDAGQLHVTVEDEKDVADACQRVAHAAVSVAEATTYLPRLRPKEMEFVDIISSKLYQREIAVEPQRSLEGASGHPHTATLFLPRSETVLEPIGSDRAWNVAAAVYVKFGDLSKVNGYRLVAILDDRENDPGPDVSNLLGQVAEVASWRQHDAWIAEVGS